MVSRIHSADCTRVFNLSDADLLEGETEHTHHYITKLIMNVIELVEWRSIVVEAVYWCWQYIYTPCPTITSFSSHADAAPSHWSMTTHYLLTVTTNKKNDPPTSPSASDFWRAYRCSVDECEEMVIQLYSNQNSWSPLCESGIYLVFQLTWESLSLLYYDIFLYYNYIW